MSLTVNTVVMSFKDRTLSVTHSQRVDQYSQGNIEIESQSNLNHLMHSQQEYQTKMSTKSCKSFRSV